VDTIEGTRTTLFSVCSQGNTCPCIFDIFATTSHLQSIAEYCKQNNKRLAFVEIPVLSNTGEPYHTIDFLNGALLDLVGREDFIALNQELMVGDLFHYNLKSAKYVAAALNLYALCLN
jgi:hypothetical protein